MCESGCLVYDVDSKNIVVEALTIPENPDDEIEKQLRKKLPKNYEHSDRIVRWYRNEKKSGTSDKELKSLFVDDIGNVLDLLKSYDKYVQDLKRMKMLKKIDLNVQGGKTVSFDPVKDFDKIRKLNGARVLI